MRQPHIRFTFPLFLPRSLQYRSCNLLERFQLNTPNAGSDTCTFINGRSCMYASLWTVY